jgi:exopolysaccharide biosynthesis operon protein EpsL
VFAAALAAALLAPPAAAQQDPPDLPAPAEAAQQDPPDPLAPPEGAQQDPPDLAAPPEAAQQDRPVMLQVGGSLASNTNPLRLSQPRADLVTILFAGLRVNRPFAQQRLLLDVTGTAYRYARLSFLDFNALNYRGLWAWQLGGRWSGMLGSERVQSLADYSEFRDSSQRNVLTVQRTFLSIDGWLFGGWHVLGGLEQQEHKNSVPFAQRGSYRANGGEAGLSYLAPSGSSATLKRRALEGQYIDRPLDPVARLDDGFKRSESELSVLWVASARSAFEGRITRIEYRSGHFAERDFSGTAGALDYRWQPTARLMVHAGASRGLDSYSDRFASYRVAKRLVLEAAWQVAARTTLRLGTARQASDFRNPLPGFVGEQRADTLRTVQLGLEWKVRRNVTVNASLQRERQSSTDPAVQFEARIASLGGSARF